MVWMWGMGVGWRWYGADGVVVEDWVWVGGWRVDVGMVILGGG